MPDLKKRPSAHFIDSVFTQLDNIWTHSHTDWQKRTSEINLDFAIWSTPEAQLSRAEKHPSTAANIMFRALSTQFSAKPSWHRPPRVDSEGIAITTAKESADRIERAMDALMTDSAMKEVLNPWIEIPKWLVALDYVVVEGPVLDSEAWVNRPRPPEEEDFTEEGTLDEVAFKAADELFKTEKRNWNPIRIRVHRPDSVLMDPNQARPPMAIKRESLYAGDLENLSSTKAAKNAGTVRNSKGTIVKRVTHNRFKMTGDDYYEKVEILHFWSNHWHAVKLKTGDLLYSEPNILGIQPFKHRFSGRGVPVIGEDGLDPKYITRGITWAIKDDLVVEAQQFNAQNELFINTAYAPMGTEGDPTEMAKVLSKDGILQGSETDYWIMKTQTLAPWMDQAQARVEADIEKATGASTLGGLRQTGVSTVGQQAQLSNAERAQFDGHQQQAASLVSEIGQDVLRLIIALSVDTDINQIGINGHILRASDIANDVTLLARFDKIDPALQIQERQVSMAEFDRELIDAATYRRDARRMTDETGVTDAIIEGKVLNRPSMIEIKARKMAAIIGEQEDFDAALALEQSPEEPINAPEGSSRDGNFNQTRTTANLNDTTPNPQRVG